MSELVKRRLFRDIDRKLEQLEELNEGPVKRSLLGMATLDAIKLTLYMGDEQ